jgi:hypothetical protein
MFFAGQTLVCWLPLRPDRLHRQPVREHGVMSNLVELGEG